MLVTVRPTDCPIPIYFASLAFCKTITLPELTAWIGKLEDIPINEYSLYVPATPGFDVLPPQVCYWNSNVVDAGESV